MKPILSRLNVQKSEQQNIKQQNIISNPLWIFKFFLLLLLSVTVSQYSTAQCLTDSLTINTGYDPITGTAITPGPDYLASVQDYYWTVSPNVNIVNAVASTPTNTTTSSYFPAGGYATIVTSGGKADVITKRTGWDIRPNSSWISCLNSSWYACDGSGSAQIDTISRIFNICMDDSIKFKFDTILDDNYISAVIIDPNSASPIVLGYSEIPAATNWLNPGGHFMITKWITAGKHQLAFILNNLNPPPAGLNGMGMDMQGSIVSATGKSSIKSESSAICDTLPCSCTCQHDTGSSCPETCFWRLVGNHISGSNNIFGTISNDNVNIMTDNVNRGIFTKDGMFGWNTNPTTDPTSAYLHINCTGHNQGPTLSDIRFENLETNPKGNIMVIDPQSGYVFNSGINLSNPVTLSCSSTNILPKVTGSGVLGCSIVYDNGASVGINKTSGFTYTWAGGLSGTTPPPGSGIVALDVNGVTRALAYIATSDERLKTNIKSISNPFKLINGLTGKTYSWNQAVLQETHADNSRQYGFIAQDVAKVMPEAVIVDSAGTYGINYNSFIPVLTEGEKELYTMYQQEKANNDKLQSQLDDLKARLDDLANCCANNTVTSSISKDVTANTGNALYQNVPNPFNKETSIGYFISKMNGSAAIIISDLSGKEMSRYQIAAPGQGSISVKIQNMVPGIYLYTLVVDGSVIDAKRMVIGG